MKLSPEIKNQFLLFMTGDIPISNFEEWVYANENLSSALSEEAYLKLLEFNFKKCGAKYELMSLIESYLDQGEYYKYLITKLIIHLAKEDEHFTEALMNCYNLYCKGCFFLEDLGLAWGLMLEYPPAHYGVESWDELTSEQKSNIAQELDMNEIRIEVALLKKWIEFNEIVFTGKVDNLGYWEFIDNRQENEKKSRMWIKKSEN